MQTVISDFKNLLFKMDSDIIAGKNISTDEVIRIVELYDNFNHKLDLNAGFVRWIEYSSTLTNILNRWANSNSPVGAEQLNQLLMRKAALTSAYLTGHDIEQRSLLRNYNPKNNYKQNFTKLLLLISINNLNQELFSAFISATDDVAFYLAIGWLSERAIMTKNAQIYHQKIVDNFNRFENLDVDLSFLSNISKAYMYTTYSSSISKDQIKNVMHRMISKTIKLKSDTSAFDFVNKSIRKKPRILVIHENFSDTHVMMRCYLGILTKLDQTYEAYHLTWFKDGYDDTKSKLKKVLVTEENLNDIVAKIRNLKPDVILYPSIGMSTLVISLSSLRLAPIQLQLFGHPSSSNSPVIDGSLINSVNFQNTGNEKLTTNKAFMRGIHWPFALKPLENNLSCHFHSKQNNFLSIGINSIVMKLNPEFMAFLSQISWPENSKLNFFPSERGSHQLASSNLIKRFFPTAHIHPILNYESFMQQLAMQDLSICSFPFGNTNGMLDCLRLGLPTFVLRGKEICSSSEYELLTECGLGNFIFENKTELKKSINKFLIDSDWRLDMQAHFKIKAAKYIAKNDIEQAIDYEASLFISWIKSTIEDYNNFALHADLEYQ